MVHPTLNSEILIQTGISDGLQYILTDALIYFPSNTDDGISFYFPISPHPPTGSKSPPGPSHAFDKPQLTDLPLSPHPSTLPPRDVHHSTLIHSTACRHLSAYVIHTSSAQNKPPSVNGPIRRAPHPRTFHRSSQTIYQGCAPSH